MPATRTGVGTWFRAWRRTRPFLAGLVTTLAGLELLFVPLWSAKFLLVQGVTGVGALLAGAVLVGCGILLLRLPHRRVPLGIVVLVFGFVSYVTTNLGGFLVGMVLALVGGSLALAWSPPRPAGTNTEVRRTTDVAEPT
ncbi:hypothetical protein SAMN05421810_104151 [Amycolatopsis arida]|uniref:Integral membrane protein n=1 Tax=Amycolatopsis arida TaxID=587909 RepID=A0A1I5UXE3_9PSEU|nr:DUF6114 domain-containing protein [Amycolatopsis arida]TDX91070.1 hypothetical protein CLV69_106150 [Amycolatopsis arida]SFP99925.1 hypothetical protein SAMN05421810_104151 [Amycolatopsis arida]